jgi:hypothetical protein
MKALLTIIDWQKNKIAFSQFFQGEKADMEALSFWEKSEWPGCCCSIEWDEELRREKTRKEPAHVRVGNNLIMLFYILPNNAQTRAAIRKDDRAQIISLADPRAPAEGRPFFTLQYAANATPETLSAFENNDWFGILEQAYPVFEET